MIRSAIVTFSLGLTMLAGQTDDLQPYLEYAYQGTDIEAASEDIAGRIEAAGLRFLGRYAPADDPGRMIIVVTGDDLISAVAASAPTTGFALAMRVAITRQDGQLVLSSQNPPYWGNAYFQDGYPAVAGRIEAFAATLAGALGGSGMGFGSAEDLSDKDLRRYHYMFGMPYFKDMVKLAKFPSFDEAVAAIEANLAASQVASKVFQVQVPDKTVRLYGIALGGERGESRFVPIIDFGERKHTAFLPYGLLVMDGEVVMLHGRFRIALSFPDLTMGTFSKIMATPGDIKKLMRTLTK